MVVRKTVDKAPEPAKALAKPVFTRFSDEELLSITNFQDAMALSASTFGDILDIRDLELGNGFKVTKDKDRLVEVPFIIIQSQFWMGDYNEFASLMIVTERDQKIITNDGGSGVCTDLRRMINKTGRNGGFYVPNGYRKSEYSCCPECGMPLRPRDSNGPITVCTQDENRDGCGKDVGERRQPGATFYFDFAEDRIGR